MKLRKTEFYAIKELSSELFLTHNELCFLPLGDRTKLFDSMSDAVAHLNFKDYEFRNAYLWDSLEKATGESRFDIDIDFDTYRNLLKDIKFKVTKVHLEEVLYPEEN